MTNNINTKLIIELRKITSAGISICKEALENTNYQIDDAIKYLTKKGISKAQSKNDRKTQEGVVCVAFNDDMSKGSIVKINSETDFVARNPKFHEFAEKITKESLKFNDITELMGSKLDNDLTIQDELHRNISVIGENLTISTLKYIIVNDKKSDVLGYSVHNPIKDSIGSIAAICHLNIQGDISEEHKTKLSSLARKVSLHIASMDVKYISTKDIKNDSMDQTDDLILLEQKYILNEKLTIQEFLDQQTNMMGVEKIQIRNFIKIRVDE